MKEEPAVEVVAEEVELVVEEEVSIEPVVEIIAPTELVVEEEEIFLESELEVKEELMESVVEDSVSSLDVREMSPNAEIVAYCAPCMPEDMEVGPTIEFYSPPGIEIDIANDEMTMPILK